MDRRARKWIVAGLGAAALAVVAAGVPAFIPAVAERYRAHVMRSGSGEEAWRAALRLEGGGRWARAAAEEWYVSRLVAPPGGKLTPGIEVHARAALTRIAAFGSPAAIPPVARAMQDLLRSGTIHVTRGSGEETLRPKDFSDAIEAIAKRHRGAAARDLLRAVEGCDGMPAAICIHLLGRFGREGGVDAARLLAAAKGKSPVAETTLPEAVESLEGR